MTTWTEFYANDFEQVETDGDGEAWLVNTAPVDEWRCTQCGDHLGFWSDGEGGGWWLVPWCPTAEFDAATMVCETCVPDDDEDSEVGCALCGEVGLPIIGHADTCRGAA